MQRSLHEQCQRLQTWRHSTPRSEHVDLVQPVSYYWRAARPIARDLLCEELLVAELLQPNTTQFLLLPIRARHMRYVCNNKVVQARRAASHTTSIRMIGPGVFDRAVLRRARAAE